MSKITTTLETIERIQDSKKMSLDQALAIEKKLEALRMFLRNNVKSIADELVADKKLESAITVTNSYWVLTAADAIDRSGINNGGEILKVLKESARPETLIITGYLLGKLVAEGNAELLAVLNDLPDSDTALIAITKLLVATFEEATHKEFLDNLVPEDKGGLVQ